MSYQLFAISQFVSGRRDTVENDFPIIRAGILGKWERVEGKLERVGRLMRS